MTSLFAIFRMKSAFGQLSGPAMWKRHSSPTLGVGIFAAGNVSSAVPSDKYNFSANTSVATVNLGGNRVAWQAAGYRTFGVFAGSGPVVHDTQIYTYASDSVSAGTDIGNIWWFASVGNETQGIFAGGRNGGNPLTATRKYIFSNHALSAGTNLGSPREAFAGTGISSFGLFAGGLYVSTLYSTTEKYFHSSDSVSSGTSLAQTLDYHGGAGNATMGVFAGGERYVGANQYTTVSHIYTYSSNSTSMGTAVAIPRYALAATGDATVGIFGVGSGVTVAQQFSCVDRYTYSSNTFTTGANAVAWRAGGAASSSSPGGC